MQKKQRCEGWSPRRAQSISGDTRGGKRRGKQEKKKRSTHCTDRIHQQQLNNDTRALSSLLHRVHLRLKLHDVGLELLRGQLESLDLRPLVSLASAQAMGEGAERVHRYLRTASHSPSCILLGCNNKPRLLQPQTRKESPAPCREHSQHDNLVRSSGEDVSPSTECPNGLLGRQ